MRVYLFESRREDNPKGDYKYAFKDSKDQPNFLLTSI